ncbi:MAG: hypothetical protein WCC26_00010 [Terracidiphilus sp.]
MTGNRNKRAWIWLAVAAIAAVTLARAQAGAPSAATYPGSVLAFLSGHTLDADFAGSAFPGMHAPRADRPVRNASRLASSGAWMAVLPVLFVGLIAPLSLISPRSALCLGRTPSAPAGISLFQRPPPSLG